MNLRRFTAIGLTISIFFVLHAAMLAGGAHAAHSRPAAEHAHAQSHSMPTEAMELAALPADAPSIRSPEMADCLLIGTPLARHDLVVAAASSSVSEIYPLASSAAAQIYAPIVTGMSRAQLQVFLI